MKYEKRLFLLAFLLCFALMSCGGDGNPIAPAVNDLSGIPALMEFYKVPGVSIALIKDFKIDRLLVFGVRNQNTNKLVSEETLFQAGSISKPVAAVAALKFVQNRMIDLDEDINNKLTSWKVAENGFTVQQKVTLRRLLSHTAGTTVHGFGGYRYTEVIPSLVRILNGEPPANSPPIVVDKNPGSGFRYSGGGYVIMQQALIDIAQKPFPQILQETVLQPLMMSNSAYVQPLPQDKMPNASVGHYSDGNAVQGNHHIYPELAAAGLWTTPRDLALFLVDLQLSLQGQSNRVLNSEMVEQMMRPVGNSSVALGVGIQNGSHGQYFGHDGANRGFRLLMQAHKTAGVGAVVMRQ